MAATTDTYLESQEVADRTDNRLRTISIVLAVIGVLVSAYLSWSKLTGTETVCIQGLSNCSVVQNSIYAYIGPISVAYLGLAGYAAILVTLLLETRVSFLARRGKLLILGMTLFGFLFSGYLTAIEAFVLREWCQWCVISAITMTLLFGIAFARLWRSISAVQDA